VLVEPRAIVSLLTGRTIIARSLSGDRNVDSVDFAPIAFDSPEKRWAKANDRRRSHIADEAHGLEPSNSNLFAKSCEFIQLTR
jgi:hypothetical protein